MRRMLVNAPELDKYIILSGNFNFQTEALEEASKHEPWSKIANIFNNGSAYKPILIFDIIDVTLYFGTQENDTLYLQSLYTNQGCILEIQYDITTDKLTITKTVENYLSEDNVKTLFGNQSIIGTGNIDLYRHDITIMGTLSITVYSSSNLKIDSVQDLTTVLKPYVGLVLGGVWYDKLNDNSEIAGYGALIYKSDNLWYMLLNTTESNNILVNSVTDVVTTI